MFSAVIFALFAAASAQFVSQYPNQYYSSNGYGVNPVVHQTPVPHVNHNYGFVNQKYVPNTYGTFGVNNNGFSGYNGYTNAQTYAQTYPQTYAAPITAPLYDRDYNIEQVGEKYAYQSGPASFNYHFVKGADTVPTTTGAVSYGVPHHARVSAAVPTVGAYNPYHNVFATNEHQYVPTFSAKLRTSPVVPKFDTYSAKDLVTAH